MFGPQLVFSRIVYSGAQAKKRAAAQVIADAKVTKYDVWYVLGSWVGVRRLFHLSLFLTASRMVLPQDPCTDPNCALHMSIMTRGTRPLWDEKGGGGQSLVIL